MLGGCTVLEVFRGLLESNDKGEKNRAAPKGFLRENAFGGKVTRSLERGRGVTARGGTVLRTSQDF